ncbi:trithorax group protein osa-like isoform X1 [Lutzomyia longipalpis]|uniref:trithorax group protein osa-like isoform X1 n=1 Tax=Lutzomyia longipalpis TaxID=7200 RepID=UPI0024842C6C|nr:trithorax group protein osa-like isoform X1 [Lutzomyia longipalpis]
MMRTMSSESKRLLKTLSLAVLLLSLCAYGDARKSPGSSRRGGSSPSRVQKPTYTQPSQSSNSHADQARLSYSGYNQQPNRAPQQPSAPAAHPAPAQQPAQNIGWNTNAQPAGGANSRPVGWNVDQPAQKQNVAPANAAAPPYPVQSGANPPPYSAVQNHGPPPPYSAQAQPNPASGYHPPPPYSPQAGVPNQPHYAGAPPPYQGGYPQQGVPPAGGYPQQPAFGQPGYGQPGYGHPNYPGGYQQPGYQGGQPVVNNYYGNQGSSGGSGWQTAALAGVGGLALYGALKPSEHNTIIIQNGTNAAPPAAAPADGAAAAAAAPAAAAPGAAPVNGSIPVNGTGTEPIYSAPLAPYPIDCTPYWNQMNQMNQANQANQANQMNQVNQSSTSTSAGTTTADVSTTTEGITSTMEITNCTAENCTTTTVVTELPTTTPIPLAIPPQCMYPQQQQPQMTNGAPLAPWPANYPAPGQPGYQPPYQPPADPYNHPPPPPSSSFQNQPVVQASNPATPANAQPVSSSVSKTLSSALLTTVTILAGVLVQL